MASVVRLIELAIPLRDTFANAGTAVDLRRIILVGVEVEGVTGWGEAAPYPGINIESTDEIWDMLSQQPRLAAGRVIEMLPSTAAAAIDQAHADLSARQRAVPMWQYLGGRDGPVRATVAIGLSPTPSSTVASVYAAHEAGFTAVKLKIAPDHDHGHISAVRDTYPELSISVDANGSYRLDDPLFETIDDLDLAYIEQPFPAVRAGDHDVLRTRIETPVCLDESMHTYAAARRAIAEQAADIVTLKAALLGPTAVAELARLAVTAGMEVKMSGLIETSVGRSHTLALATLPGVIHADLAPPRWFLASDVANADWNLVNGAFVPYAGPGLDVDVDELALGGIVERTSTLDVS